MTRILAVLLGVLVAGVPSAAAQPEAPGLRPAPGQVSSAVPDALKGVSFDQNLDAALPLDAAFRDEEGRPVRLGDYFGRRPVVLAFVYYECPMLCTQVLNGLARTLEAMDETVGREFDVVTVSFDPRETPVLAAGKKKVYLDRYAREGAGTGWHFLTGDEPSIRALTDAAGFHYAWDERTSQFAHASGIVVATPDGRVSRYFFGIEYAPRDLKFALMESSAGRIGSAVDKLLLYCYHYDPQTGSYSFVAMNAVRMGGAVTLVALVGFVVVMIRRESRAGQ
ncbi:MAG: SCO family protein [Acidobacteriota bacterium]